MNAAPAFTLRWLTALVGAALLWTGTAEAVPSTSVKECAQADLDKATHHDKKAKRSKAACDKALADIKAGRRAAPPSAPRKARPARSKPQAQHAQQAGKARSVVRHAPPKVQAPPRRQNSFLQQQALLAQRRLLAERQRHAEQRRLVALARQRAARRAPPARVARPGAVVPATYVKPAPAPAFNPQAAARENQARRDKAMRDATIASLANDTRAIGKEHASVFGITLGEALVLPACDASSAGANPNATCLQKDKLATRSLAMRMADASQARFPKDVDFDLVRLGSERCPSWVGSECNVSVVTKSGFVVGVAYFTSGTPEKDVAKSIEEQYDNPPSAQVEAVCAADVGKKAVSRKGSHRSWDLPSLSVNYAPLAGRSCDEGRVQIETTTLSRSLKRPSVQTASNDVSADDSFTPKP